MVTMLTHMIPQKPLAGKSFATMFTYQRLCSNKRRKYTDITIVVNTFSAISTREREESFSPTGSACLCKWSNSFVLLENMLPHVGQATSLSWVWLRMCSLKRYLILKKASQPAIETWRIVTVRHEVRRTRSNSLTSSRSVVPVQWQKRACNCCGRDCGSALSTWLSTCR